MSSDNDLERLLTRTPGPRVVAGAHRADLKARLLQSMRKERPVKTIWKPLLVACSVICCVVLLLAAGGWAANEVRARFFVVEESCEQGETVVNPDGSVTSTSTARKVVVGSNDPEFTEEDAHRQWAKTKQAIDQGNYSLFQEKETETGQPVYIYRVVLEDGTTDHYGTNEPLPDAPRFDDLIRRAIDQGNYTLLRQKQTESGQPVYVYRLELEDGTTHRYGTGEPLSDGQRPVSPTQKAIEEGNYTLVEVKELQGHTVYIYRVVLDDGSVRSFGTNVKLPEPKNE